MKTPVKRKVIVSVSSEFAASYRKFFRIESSIKEALTTFNKYKREIPPRRLPDKMRDHKLGGDLNDFLECHLSGDVLLIYTHQDDRVHLLLCCAHRDLKPPKSKGLSGRLTALKWKRRARK